MSQIEAFVFCSGFNFANMMCHLLELGSINRIISTSWHIKFAKLKLLSSKGWTVCLMTPPPKWYAYIFSGTVYSDDRNHFWKLHHFHIYSISTFNIQVSKGKFFHFEYFFMNRFPSLASWERLGGFLGILWASCGLSNIIH